MREKKGREAWGHKGTEGERRTDGRRTDGWTDELEEEEGGRK